MTAWIEEAEVELDALVISAEKLKWSADTKVEHELLPSSSDGLSIIS